MNQRRRPFASLRLPFFDFPAVALAAALALAALSGAPALAQWKAGVATQNITPKHLMWMAGYGSRTMPAESKLTDLWAKALVLEDASGQRAVLVTLDLVGIGRELSSRICGTIQQKHNLDRRQISLCTSHTHCGPAVGRNLGPLHYLQVDEHQQALIDEYADALHDQVVDVVDRAAKQLAPAQLSHGVGVSTFAVNRRENPADQVPARRAAGTLKGPFDHDAPVLAIRDAQGKLKTVVFGYACHATVLSFYQWCGDYPGFAQEELEKRHEGCVAMFWAGCGADQNPLPRREVELAKKYGGMLADSVDAVLKRDMRPVQPRLVTRYEEVTAPLAVPPGKAHWEELAKSNNRFEKARANMFLEQLEAGKTLPSTYPYPIQCWQLGDVTWVILGGEVVVDYVLRLKQELKSLPSKVWVAGYANDVMAYIPSRRVLREGGYEGGGSMVYYGLPNVWAPEVENLIVETAKKLAAR